MVKKRSAAGQECSLCPADLLHPVRQVTVNCATEQPGPLLRSREASLVSDAQAAGQPTPIVSLNQHFPPVTWKFLWVVWHEYPHSNSPRKLYLLYLFAHKRQHQSRDTVAYLSKLTSLHFSHFETSSKPVLKTKVASSLQEEVLKEAHMILMSRQPGVRSS